MIKKVFIFLFLVLISCLSFTPEVKAQVTSSAITEQIQLSSQFENGTILCNGKNGFEACASRYLSTIYGVVTSDPAGELVSTDVTAGTFIARGGVTQVKVSSSNGAIQAGDLITTSQTSGVGMKADRNGYVVGAALEAFSGTDTGIIQVAINIHPTTVFTDSRNNLLELLRDLVNAPILTPLAALRYLIAAAVTLSAFIMGFRYFGKIARTGIEAIGRNPLARTTIYSTVVLNILIMIVIFLSGLTLSYLILTL